MPERTDTERLDWMERQWRVSLVAGTNIDAVAHGEVECRLGTLTTDHDVWVDPERITPRQAIDAAMDREAADAQ